MKPIVSIIMGSTSDLPVMEKAMKWLEDQEIPFEVNALSAHRTPDAVEEFAKNAKSRGIKVINAGAGMTAQAGMQGQSPAAGGAIPKFCPNCGTPTNGMKFCGNCGNKLG